MTRFVGYSEDEIRAVERSIGAPLPQMYRGFLSSMGVRCGGDLSCGLELPDPGQERVFAARARQILERSDSRLQMPPHAAVIYLKERYIFGYVVGGGSKDSPVVEFSEDEGELREAAPSFKELVLRWVSDIEDGHRVALEAGGWFLTINKKFGQKREYPARDSGIRPIALDDEFCD